MPPSTESFWEGLWYIIKKAIENINPSLAEASGVCLSLVCICLLISILRSVNKQARSSVIITGVISIGILLLNATDSLVHMASGTVTELSQYGKLLMPVMTTALAAEGGTSSSGALYAGTVLFCNILTTLISKLVVPMIYMYLCLAVAWNAIGEDILKDFRDFIKWLITWSMKIVLYIFSGYMSITKIITGSVDASAIRATKLTISGLVPVVGNIISDASETLLVSAGLVKNSVGIYGLLAILSVIIGPFIKIGVQYLMLKLTSAISSVFGIKQLSGIIGDFSKAISMSLAMIGIIALLLMISTVCFMKGIA